MNNKTIVLGYVDVDWHFAMGKFSCSCTTIEDTDAFDRVICGILYRSRNMLKSELATIIGLNVVNEPDQGRYCDRSEYAIFENAIHSLVDYGLIIEDDNCLSLTEIGKESCESRTKQKIEIKDVELWVDEFAGLDFQQEMIKGLSYRPSEYANHPDWNILITSPLEVLQSQHKELVNINKRKSVTDINCNSLSYYVASLQCKICYNLENQEIYACSAVESQDINDMLLKNTLLHNRIIEDFFANQQVSVIYKPVHQIEMEKNILNSDTVETSYTDCISHKNDFFKQLNSDLDRDEASIPFFSLYEIDDEIRQTLKKVKSDIVCVDYVNGEIVQSPVENNSLIDNNICYCRFNKLRTSDFCVFGNTYYQSLPYVIEFKGSSYSIPLIYKYSGEKYHKSVLFAPFINHILDQIIIIGRSSIDRINNSLSSHSVNKVVKYFDIIYKIIDSEQLNTNINNKISTIDSLKQQILSIWYANLNDKLKNLEAEILAGQERVLSNAILNDIETNFNATPFNEDIFRLINDVKQRLNESKNVIELNIKKQTIYILDTSVFMDMPKILERFDLRHDRVIVPRAMEQELDGLSKDPLKKANADLAKQQIRRKKKDYPQFLSLKDDVDRSLLPNGFNPNLKDNDMLASAIELENNNNIEKVIIVANDNEFISNVQDCVDKEIISGRIEGINLNELLMRLGE